jgi:hypothetical protein
VASSPERADWFMIVFLAAGLVACLFDLWIIMGGSL